MTATDVVVRHLDAVRSGDPAAMAAGYADHAVLVRPDTTHRGLAAIRRYFLSVPERLGDGRVDFGGPTGSGESLVVAWRIVGGPGDGTTGRDTYVVRDGLIVHQHVDLDAEDF